MRRADIIFVRKLSKYLGVTQSEIVRILVDRARSEPGFITKIADELEEKAKQLRKLKTASQIEEQTD
jgi:hypothetical protein